MLTSCFQTSFISFIKVFMKFFEIHKNYNCINFFYFDVMNHQHQEVMPKEFATVIFVLEGVQRR